MDTLKKRRFDFINEKTFNLLDKKMKKNLSDYREQYRLCILKEKRINSLKKQIKEQQDLLRLMKRDLTELSEPLEQVRNDFQFFCSITSYVKGKYRYYNLCISRVIKSNPKNVGLGREDTDRGIVKHLLKYYKNDKKKIREIKKDWKLFLKDECNIYDTYDRIMKIIVKNPHTWKELKINKYDLFPIK